VALALAPRSHAAATGEVVVDAADRIAPGGRVTPGRWSVLVVVLDDVGLDKLSLYPLGTDTAHTPTLEALAAEGVTYTQAYAAPVCSPTRACLMSGRYAFRTGMGSNVRSPAGYPLPDEEVGLGELAQEPLPIAYVSAAFGKWHLTHVTGDERHPVRAAGFGSFSGHMGNLGDDDATVQDPGHFAWRKIGVKTTGYTETFLSAPPFDTTVFATSVQRAEVQAWIAVQERPFVAYWAPSAPHAPFQVPPHELLSADTIAGVPRGFAQPLPAPDGTVFDDDPEVRRQVFHALIEGFDTELGLLLEGLGEKRAETVVVLFGDNGTPGQVMSEGFDPSHGKGSIFQQSVQVPLVVAGPIVDEPGRTCDALVHAVDVWAAVAELVGTRASSLPPDTVFDGTSFLDTVADADAPQRRTRVFCERFNPGGFDAEGAPDADLLQRCYLDGRYKYVFEREADGEGSGPVSERFYDIDADPLELVDLRATGTWTPEEQWRFATLRLEMLDLVGDGPPQPAGSAPLHHREIRLPR
jgi:arylsulfatase A-like enzyme